MNYKLFNKQVDGSSEIIRLKPHAITNINSMVTFMHTGPNAEEEERYENRITFSLSNGQSFNYVVSHDDFIESLGDADLTDLLLLNHTQFEGMTQDEFITFLNKVYGKTNEIDWGEDVGKKRLDGEA